MNLRVISYRTWQPFNPAALGLFADDGGAPAGGGGAGAGGGDGGAGGAAGGAKDDAGGSDKGGGAPADKAGGDAGGSKDGDKGAAGKAPVDILGGNDETDGQQGDGQGAKGAGESKADKPGQTGELEIVLPEGMEVDPALLTKFKAFATEHKLDGKQASAIAAFQHQMNQDLVAGWQAERARNHQQWGEQVAKDPELGGSEEKLAATVLGARRAISESGGEPLQKVLREAGISNHPAVVRSYFRLSKLLAEDTGAGKGAKEGGSSDQSRWDAAVYNQPAKKAG